MSSRSLNFRLWSSALKGEKDFLLPSGWEAVLVLKACSEERAELTRKTIERWLKPRVPLRNRAALTKHAPFK